MSKKLYISTKTYTHSVGLSCCFRQWRAAHSHCRYLHGYSLEVIIEFASTQLDNRNWVVDFGSLSAVKNMLIDTFDHKTVIAEDDPELPIFRDMMKKDLIDLIVLPDVGCEKFADHIYSKVETWLSQYNIAQKRAVSSFARGLGQLEPALLHSVEVREHAGNSAKVVTLYDR